MTDKCVVWAGRVNEHGYGVVGRHRYAHRVAWEVANGPIPAGGCILHTCDNPPCVNVAHLRLGTRTENSADMVAKGRSAKGERHSQAILTEADVLAIRGLCRIGMTHKRIGELFGVSRQTVDSIFLRKRWGYLADVAIETVRGVSVAGFPTPPATDR